jgi:hypothetical protein
MMKQFKLKHFLLLTLTACLYFGCAKQEPVASIQPTETLEKEAMTKQLIKEESPAPLYGENTEEIEKFLSTAPLGSEIYLEEREDGSFYLKVEKTFTAKNEERQEVKKEEPMYGETILI